jgi:hypothetical protein
MLCNQANSVWFYCIVFIRIVALSANTQHYEYAAMRILIVYYLFRFSDRLDFKEMSLTSLNSGIVPIVRFNKISVAISVNYVRAFFYMDNHNCQ